MIKKLFFLLLLPVFAYSQPQLCAVYGTFYNFDGSVADSVDVTVVRVYDSTGNVIHSQPQSYMTDVNGQVSFNIVRPSTAYIAARAMNWDQYGFMGRAIAIPDLPTGDISTFSAPITIPQSHIVIVPSLFVTDSTTGLGMRTDTLRFGTGFKLIAATNGGGNPTMIVTAVGGATDTNSLSYRINVNKDAIAGKGDSDSLSTTTATANAALPKSDTTALHAQQLANLRDKDGGFADADSVKTIYDIAGGKGDSDSLSTTTATANAALPKADTTALHAQQLANLRDKDGGFADADSVKTLYDIAGGKGDSDSLSTTTATANAAMPLANVDDTLSVALTLGARSISSTGRMYVSDDSLTLTVAPNETINAALGNLFRGTLTQNDTLGIANMVDGQVIQVVVTNAATYTLNWTGVAWPAGTEPVATATANKRTIYSLMKAGGMIYGVSVLNF